MTSLMRKPRSVTELLEVEGMFPALDFSDLLDIRDYLLSNCTNSTIPIVSKGYSEAGSCTFIEEGKSCYYKHLTESSGFSMTTLCEVWVGFNTKERIEAQVHIKKRRGPRLN